EPTRPYDLAEEGEAADRRMLAGDEFHSAIAEEIDTDQEQGDCRADIACTHRALISERILTAGLASTDAIAHEEKNRWYQAQDLADHLGLERLAAAHDEGQKNDRRQDVGNARPCELVRLLQLLFRAGPLRDA